MFYVSIRIFYSAHNFDWHLSIIDVLYILWNHVSTLWVLSKSNCMPQPLKIIQLVPQSGLWVVPCHIEDKHVAQSVHIASICPSFPNLVQACILWWMTLAMYMSYLNLTELSNYSSIPKDVTIYLQRRIPSATKWCICTFAGSENL